LIGDGKMKLTPQTLQKIIDDYDIQNSNCEFSDALVVQTKMACSIYNQSPATDELTVEWLKSQCDVLDFCHSQLAVRNKNGTYSYYDHKETDDVLRMAFHYQLDLTSIESTWICTSGFGITAIQFRSANPVLAIMGCISKLDEKAHAYVS
jgi:hypothetical protein